MHQFLHDRLRKSVSNGGLEIGAAPKGTAQNRFTTEFLNDSLKFANHSVVDYSAKWRELTGVPWRRSPVALDPSVGSGAILGVESKESILALSI